MAGPRSGSGRTRKSTPASRRNNSQSHTTHKRARPTLDLAASVDEHIDSDEEEHFEDRLEGREPSLEDEQSEEEENVEAKRVRMAREYLERMDQHSDSDDTSDDGDNDNDSDQDDVQDDRVARKLQRVRLKREGTFERVVADKLATRLSALQPPSYDTTTAVVSVAVGTTATVAVITTPRQQAQAWIAAGHQRLLRGHDLTPTCVALQSDGATAISGSKDHSVILWDIETASRKTHLCPVWKKETADSSKPRTVGEVLSVACSDDGRYAAVGSRDATVRVFDIRSRSQALVQTFTGHKGAVTSLAFRTNSLQLFSGSDDRCIRHYNLSEMLYIETLYGHQFGVTDLDCHRDERPVSVGKDRTARAWKLAEDTHLIFRGGSKLPSASSVTVVKDDWFVTGHEDGHLAMWKTDKKKAVAQIANAHGDDTEIVAVQALPGSDLVASGSYDGYVRFWKASTGRTLAERGLQAVGEIPLFGYVNDIAFGPKARFCVAAVGQEHRLGRWNRVAQAKNRLAIVQLQANDTASDDDDIIVEDIDGPPQTDTASSADDDATSEDDSQ